MPPAVIARVNLLGKAEPSILTFTDRHGHEIGDYTQDEHTADEDGLVVEYDHIDDVLPVISLQDDNQIPGVHKEPPAKPTGVEVDPEKVPQETNFEVDDGLEQVPQDTSHEHEPTQNPTGEPTNAPAQEDPAPPRA